MDPTSASGGDTFPSSFQTQSVHTYAMPLLVNLLEPYEIVSLRYGPSSVEGKIVFPFDGKIYAVVVSPADDATRTKRE